MVFATSTNQHHHPYRMVCSVFNAEICVTNYDCQMIMMCFCVYWMHIMRYCMDFVRWRWLALLVVGLLSILIIIIILVWMKINGVERLLYALSQVICGCRFNLAATPTTVFCSSLSSFFFQVDWIDAPNDGMNRSLHLMLLLFLCLPLAVALFYIWSENMHLKWHY